MISLKQADKVFRHGAFARATNSQVTYYYYRRFKCMAFKQTCIIKPVAYNYNNPIYYGKRK